MAFREITVGNKAVPMRASSATPYFYKAIFKQDIIRFLSSKKDINKIENKEKSNDEALKVSEAIKQLAFIMAHQASDTSNMSKLNYNSYIAWLDEIEPFALECAFEEITDLYFENLDSTSDLKKKNDQ